MSIGEVLEKNHIKIEENVSNIKQIGHIDIDSVDENFSIDNYNVLIYQYDEDNKKISYNVYKKNKLILSDVKEKEVKNYIKNLYKKFKIV